MKARMPHLSTSRTLDRWNVKVGSVTVYNYADISPTLADSYDIHGVLHVDGSTALIINDPVHARQLAAAARRLAVAMERAEETGEDQRGDRENGG